MEFVLGGTLLAVLGIISPFIISFLTKSTMSSRAKQLVALGVTLVISVAVAFIPAFGGTAVIVLGGGVSAFFSSLIAAFPIVFTIQQVVYQFIFRGTEWATNLLQNAGVKDSDTAITKTEDGESTDEDGAGLDEDTDETLSGTKGA